MGATDRIMVRLGRAATRESADELERHIRDLADENARLRGELRALRRMLARQTQAPPLSEAATATGTAGVVRERFLARREYQALLARIREIVRDTVPSDARLLAISRGDATLLDMDGRDVQHFPQNEYGVYAGYHPADSTAAITHLEALRGKGAEFLLIPATAFWWLKHYRQFRRHLDHRYRVVARQEDTCVVYSLREEDGARDGQQGYRALVAQIREVANALLPADATVAVISSGDEALLQLEGRRAWHFPQDKQGVYAGFYPADSQAAISHLEVLRARGADYFLIPRTALWWLTYYSEFAEHLARRYELVTHQARVCRIYALTPLWPFFDPQS
jgi:hypothetical protein